MPALFTLMAHHYSLAYSDSGLSGESIYAMFDEYKKIYTWVNGTLMREEKIHHISDEYLSALFSPINLVQDVAAPMVIPTDCLDHEFIESFKLEKSSAEEEPKKEAAKREFAFLTLQQVLKKEGVMAKEIRQWRQAGKIEWKTDEVMILTQSFTFIFESHQNLNTFLKRKFCQM